MKKNLILGILFVSSLSFVGCASTQRDASTGAGAAAGAAIGALAEGSGNGAEGAMDSSDQRRYYGPQGY